MVEGRGTGQLHVDIKAARHKIESGISVKDGGRDEAPSPHALLEAALASCTILTLELYAKRKEWTIGTTACQVRIESESASGTVMERTISFSETLTPEIRDRLEQIANKCPVHRVLSGSVTINTHLLG